MSKFSLKPRAKSFIHAFNGLKTIIINEPNARIHLASALIAIALGFLFQINAFEWLALVFSIGLVISIEALNTAIEELCDYIQPELHSKIKIIKDVSAAAALVAATAAFVIGLIIFIPKFLT